MLGAQDTMAKKKQKQKPKGTIITLPYETHKPRKGVAKHWINTY